MAKGIAPATRATFDVVLVGLLLLGGTLLWGCYRRLRKPRLDRSGVRGWEPLGIGA